VLGIFIVRRGYLFQFVVSQYVCFRLEVTARTKVPTGDLNV
jgi:hypothetical protein